MNAVDSRRKKYNGRGGDVSANYADKEFEAEKRQ